MVGIINVQWFDNPGAVLLCFALQKTINKLGYESEVIDYASGGAVEEKGLKKNKYLLQVDNLKNRLYKLTFVNKNFFFMGLKKRKYNYELFRSLYLKRTKRFTDCHNIILEGYDTYIVGSDVVWKPAILVSRDADIYFLSFIQDNEKKKKIAYAASVGTAEKELLLRCAERYRTKLEGFDAISVREKETANFLRKIIDKEIKCLLDPVFLLKKEEYASIMSKRLENRKYIYLYMLEFNENVIRYAKALANKTGYYILFDLHDNDNLPLMRAFGKYSKPCVSDGPAEFLSRIYYAEYIITNSFHGTAFSIIFEKEFFTFDCYNSGINISLRMENLLKEFGLYERFNPPVDMVLLKPDYTSINCKIKNENEKAIRFLKEEI